MKGYKGNIEKETLENTDYRRVLYTGKHSQLVLMSIEAGDEIGEEVHTLDQFIRVEQGIAEAVLDGATHKLEDGSAILVPSGMKHNVINSGDKPLKLYSIYSPPEHPHDVIQATKADEQEEHFDGTTTE